MSLQADAEAHLRAIRSLMEKATIYRAISAPGALAAGSLATFVGVAMMLSDGVTSLRQFFAVWLPVLAVTVVVNLVILWRGARRRDEPFLSPGMRMAMRAMLPSLVCGAVLSMCFGNEYELPSTVACWAVFYGLSLLATAHFAPRSIVWLGAAFAATGLVFALNPLVLTALPFARLHHGFTNNFSVLAQAMMVASFGLLHLIYAAAVWLAPRRAEPAGPTP